MGDEDECRASFRLEAEHQVDNRQPGCLVEIAGWFIRHKNTRIRREGSGQCDALLLAARELCRIMMKPLRQADARQFGGCAGKGIPAAGQLKRHRDVLKRRHGRNEMEGLENNADISASKARQTVFIKRSKILSGDADRAGVRSLKPGKGHQQRRFARPRGTDKANGFTAPYIERHILEDVDARCAAAKAQVDFVEVDRAFGHWVLQEGFMFPASPYGRRTALIQMLALGLAAIAPAQASQPVRLVALGDSLTAGYQLPPAAAFPAQLEKALRAKGFAVEVQNAGVSGDTSTGGLSRLDWAVGEGVQGVILELGANDALRGISPAETRASLDAIMTSLKARNIKVLLAGMRAPPNMGAEFQTAFDAIFPDLAAKHSATLYPFFLDGVAGDPSLNQADGMHPTEKGIAAIVERMLPTVEGFLKGL